MTTFISYSRINSDFAVRLAKDLKSAGFDVWLDQLDIPTGCRWDDEIEKALETKDTFMIILSPESIQSQNVKDEIGYAIDSGKNILPVVIQNCKVPFRLRRFQYVDFTGNPYEESLVKIKQLLGSIVNERLAQGSKTGNINGFVHAASRRKTNLQILAIVAGVVLIMLAILFKDKFIKANPAPFPPATSTMDLVVDMPVTTLPTLTETSMPSPKLKRENITTLLTSESFDRTLRDFAKEKYSSKDYARNTEFTYTVWLGQSEELIWHWYWCAKDEAILIRNFEHIAVTFTLNGREIPLNELVEDQYTKRDSVCRVYYTTLYDWSTGTHHLVNTAIIDQLINDGWDDYPAQERVYDYLVYLKP
jgi:hypothetical protein